MNFFHHPEKYITAPGGESLEDMSARTKEFMDDIYSGKSSPLKNVTSGYHYHKVTADSEETLNLIEKVLREKQLLVE